VSEPCRRCERLNTELAGLRAGESAPGDLQPENAWPTPAQFIRQWNTMTAPERLKRAREIIENAQYAANADHIRATS